MQREEQAVLLRIFIGEADRAGPTALRGDRRSRRASWAWPVRRCCAGRGFGHSSRMHTRKILRLSEDLPLVVEIVDTPERIDAFLPELDRMMGSGLVTLEKVRIRQYGPSARADG